MKSFLKSFQFAARGLRMAFADERNLRIHTGVALTVIVAGIYFQITTQEWCILILCIGIVFGFELLNSAIENLTDLVSPQYQPLAGKVKDISAGAVLIVSVMALVIGLLIFCKYLYLACGI